MKLQLGDKVRAVSTTAGGYWKNSYTGTFDGYTRTGKIRVKNSSGKIKSHSLSNVSKL